MDSTAALALADVPESIRRSLSTAASGMRTGREPVATMACRKRIFWGASPSTRSPREPSKTAWPPTTSTPLLRASAIRPRARRPTTRSSFHLRSGSSEIRGFPIGLQLLFPLGLGNQTGHVQERLRRDAPLEEARAAEPRARVDDDVQAQLGAAKGREVAARTAAHDRDVHLADEVAHHHAMNPCTEITLCRRAESRHTLQEQLGALEPPDDDGHQAGAVDPVGHAVVEGQGQWQHHPRDDLPVARTTGSRDAGHHRGWRPRGS